MGEKDYWNSWAVKHTGLEAVMIGSKPIIVFRDRFQKKALFGLLENLPKDFKIIEIGCGNGRWLKRMEALGFRDLTGIDISGKLIEQAKANCNASLFVMNSTGLEFPDKRFDASFLLLTLNHHNLGYFEKALREAARITRKKIFIMDETEDPK